MRGLALCLAALLLPLAVSGTAAAEVSYRGHGPEAVYSPQLSCTTVYDDWGFKTCLVEGRVIGVQTLRIVAVGATAHVVVKDVPTNTQLVVGDCAGICVLRFKDTTSAHVQLFVSSVAPMPGGVVHAGIESDPLKLI